LKIVDCPLAPLRLSNNRVTSNGLEVLVVMPGVPVAAEHDC